MATNDEAPPRIVLIPLSRSHPFNQRECTVSESLKVGRPVDKRRISPNNLIFDCRVLSRNHALIWYENGKFFIQDTKSSNGTFVNDCRLSPSGEESIPRELSTRDVVQFGVNVNVNVEKRVIHSCIVATVKLFVSGKELPGPDPDIQQVVQVVQNCLNKEQEFETKLVSMQEALNAAHVLAKESMISIVKEDELLSRLEMLENQLHVYSRNVSEDDLKRQLAKALEERHSNNIASKEKVQMILQEKIDCFTRLSQVQRDYDKAEEECQKYKTLYEALKQEHSQKISKLTDQVKLVEKQKADALEKANEEKETSLAEYNTAKNELEQLEGQLLEAQEKLNQANIQLEITRQNGGHASPTDLPNTINEGSNKPNDSRAHENEDEREKGNVDSETLPEEMTIIPSLLIGDKRLGQTKTDMLSDTVDIGSNALENKLLSQLEDKLASERNEKANLLQKLETQSKILSDLQNKSEQFGEGITITSGQQLKERESELLVLIEEKTRLMTSISLLEDENRQLEKECNISKAEMARKLAESRKMSDVMQDRISGLEASLNEARKNSVTNISSLSTPLDPFLPNSPDPRIKVLSIITLVSIAIALLSVTIAYFF